MVFQKEFMYTDDAYDAALEILEKRTFRKLNIATIALMAIFLVILIAVSLISRVYALLIIGLAIILAGGISYVFRSADLRTFIDTYSPEKWRRKFLKHYLVTLKEDKIVIGLFEVDAVRNAENNEFKTEVGTYGRLGFTPRAPRDDDAENMPPVEDEFDNFDDFDEFYIGGDDAGSNDAPANGTSETDGEVELVIGEADGEVEFIIGGDNGTDVADETDTAAETDGTSENDMDDQSEPVYQPEPVTQPEPERAPVYVSPTFIFDYDPLRCSCYENEKAFLIFRKIYDCMPVLKEQLTDEETWILRSYLSERMGKKFIRM